MRQFYIIDTTLRDGEQAPGVVFSLDEKIEVASILDAAGVPEVELGTPAISEADVAHIKSIVSQGLRFRTACWCRAVEKDIREAIRTGVDQINISFPVSDILLRVMNKDRQWLETEIKRLVTFALQRFQYVSVGAQDASRTDVQLLSWFTEAVRDNGGHRVRFADTVGIMHPGRIYDWFSFFTRHYPDVEFEFHGHNDLGMATANTLTALNSGCHCASVTVNGLGERAGNAPLEEVIAALLTSCGTDCQIDLKKLVQLSDFVANISGRPLHLSKPVSGKMAFCHESGIHCSGLEKDRLAYQPFLPEEAGRKQSYMPGRHSGRASIEKILKKAGINIEKEKFSHLMFSLKQKSLIEKRGLTESEVIGMASQSFFYTH